MSSGPRIGFIGCGRVAHVLAPALAESGRSVVALASRHIEGAAALAREIPGAQAMSAQELVNTCDQVWLTVYDDAIAQACRSLSWRPGQWVLHCSGATDLHALACAQEAGAAVGGFHPLQIFSDRQAARSSLPGSVAALETAGDSDGRLLQTLEEQALALKMSPMRLPPGVRSLYHLAAGYAASCLLGPLHEAVGLWTKAGLPPELALQALLPLSHGTLEAARRAGITHAISGPLARADLGTVGRHLQALAQLDRDASHNPTRPHQASAPGTPALTAASSHTGHYRREATWQIELLELSGRLNSKQAQSLLSLLASSAPEPADLAAASASDCPEG